MAPPTACTTLLGSCAHPRAGVVSGSPTTRVHIEPCPLDRTPPVWIVAAALLGGTALAAVTVAVTLAGVDAARAELALSEDDRLRFEVRDDGPGFSAVEAQGAGLTNMRDRVRAVRRRSRRRLDARPRRCGERLCPARPLIA